MTIDSQFLMFVTIFLLFVLGVPSFAKDREGKRVEIFRILWYGSILLAALIACLSVPTIIVQVFDIDSTVGIAASYLVGVVVYAFGFQGILESIRSKEKKQNQVVDPTPGNAPQE